MPTSPLLRALLCWMALCVAGTGVAVEARTLSAEAETETESRAGETAPTTVRRETAFVPPRAVSSLAANYAKRPTRRFAFDPVALRDLSPCALHVRSQV